MINLLVLDLKKEEKNWELFISIYFVIEKLEFVNVSDFWLISSWAWLNRDVREMNIETTKDLSYVKWIFVTMEKTSGVSVKFTL